MAIVKMKRLRLIALAEDRDALLSSLLHVGCVEISEPEAYLADADYAGLLHRDTAAVAEARAELTELQHAIEVLRKHAPQKSGMLTPRDAVGEEELLDGEALARSLALARRINDHAKTVGQLTSREARLHADQLALQPWTAYDLPLEESGSRYVSILLGAVPSTVDFDALAGAVQEAAEAVEVRLLSTDREQQYLEVLVHRSCEQEALEALRAFGFSFAQLKDLTGTVAQNIRRLDQELAQVQEKRRQELEAIRALGDRQKELKLCVDRVQQVLATETAKERLLTGGSILYLDGWASAPDVPELEKALARFDCAYDLTDPAPEEYPQVPVKLKNGPLTSPLNMVTEMYSLPAYGSLDPNPLMAPFFILFYGIMMADMGYGLLMMLAALVVVKKAKPNGPTTRHMFRLLGLCGVSTFVMGAVTGGFFGDFLPQLAQLIDPNTAFTSMPALFSPLDDALAVLIGSLALGLVQIFTGMGISMYKQIKRGEVMAALCGEGAWYVVFACIAVGAVTGAWKYALLAALVVIVLTQGYGKKGVFGKLMGIGGSLYNNITGYFSDILSYSRLMALMLAGTVIAQVFNTLGAITGNVIAFFIISMIGNALNFALNLLGCFVHDMRLQCLEFFSRFYEDGGKPFRPLDITTQYVDVIKK